ncbi:MAG: peptidoglycan-binding protein, partial [Pseudomonadota bacterium]
SSAQLEQQLAILSERIDHYAASAQQGGVSREEILETVQRAAEQTLQHALANAPSGDGGAAAAAAVREGLAELRSTQEMGDRRTKDALETVRDTVERVFHRLEALEKTRPAPRQQQPAEAPVPAPIPAEAIPAEPIDTDSSFAVDDRLRAAQEQSHDMPEDWAPIAPGGTELPRRNKAPRIDGSEATPNSRASFIAAARLAAQQSAQENEPEAGPDGAGKVTPFARIRNMLPKRATKPALLAAAAIVLTLGTLKLLTSAIETTDLTASDVAIAPPVAESPAAAPEEIARQVTAVPIPEAGEELANVARFDDMPAIGNAEQFDAPTPVDSSLLTPMAAMPGADQLEEPMNAASVQAALASDPTAARPVTGPEPSLLSALPEAIGPEALRVAAASGDPKAQYEIARRFGAGEGTEKDDAAALTWLERAAAQDLAPAQYRLGSMYEKGVGTDKDASLARAWYERAAAQGNARAMHNIGVLYAEGAFGEADFDEAVIWFEQGARLGVPDSQFNLGIIYGRGLGVPQDLAGSYMWFDASAKAGDGDAAAKRDEVAGVMDAATLETAKTQSAELVVSAPVAEANVVSLPAEMTGAQPAPQLSKADEMMLIKQVQAVLTHRGFDVGPIDGIPGGRTAKAIRAFQSQNGMTPNGRIDDALLQALSNKS